MSTGALAGRHVVVVGAGLAGLAAALECSDHGGRVTVLERQRRLGGLTWSFERAGITMDNGQHVFLRCCDAYIEFLDRIGASGDIVGPRPLDVPVVGPGPHGPVTGRLRRRDLPVPLHLAGSLFGFPHLGWRDRLLLGPVLAGLARLDLDNPGLDDVTFGEWLRRRGQSDRAVAAVWDLITIPTVNLPASEASLAAAAKVFKTGVLANRAAADIGWSRVPLGRLHGERAGAALAAAGADVRTGVRVDAVSETPGGWAVHTAGDAMAADALVLCLPPEEAADVMPRGLAAGSDRWPQLGSSAVVDVHLVFDRPVTRWELMASLHPDVQWVFDRTEASGLADVRPGAQYLAVSLSAADRLLGTRPEQIVETTLQGLADLLPAVRAAHLADSFVTKERRATFRARPGTAAIRPPAATRHPTLAIAGAWTATGWPATMESAVRSGLAAARHLVHQTRPSARTPISLEVA
jgi:squalene-associated FAD-dependent desaturase